MRLTAFSAELSAEGTPAYPRLFILHVQPSTVNVYVFGTPGQFGALVTPAYAVAVQRHCE